MIGDDGGQKLSSSVNQNMQIQRAIEALGKDNQDTRQVLSLLTSCKPDQKSELLAKLQETFRKKFGKEFWVEADPNTNERRVKTKEWKAEENDKYALSLVGDKIFNKLIITPTAKVTLDSWLQDHNEYISVGKLQWIKDYCKTTLSLDITFTREKGVLVAALQNMNSSLPPIPLISDKLKLDEPKKEESKSSKSEPTYLEQAWNSVKKSTIGGYAIAAKDLVVEKVIEPVKERVVAAAKQVKQTAIAVDNYLGSPVQGTAAVIAKLKDQAQKFVEEIAPSIFGPEKETSKTDPTKTAPSSSAVEEPEITTDGPLFRVDAVGNKQNLTLESAERSTIPLPTLPPRVPPSILTPPVELPLDILPQAEIPVAPVDPNPVLPVSKELTLPQTPPAFNPETLPSSVPPLKIEPAALPVTISTLRTIRPEAVTQAQLEPSSKLSILDLPLTPTASSKLVIESYRETIKDSIKEFELAQARQPPTVVEQVVAAMAEAVPRAVVQKEEQERYAESRVAVIRATLSANPTASSVSSAEYSLLALERNGASQAQLQEAYSIISAAKRRVEKQEEEKNKETRRVFNV